MHMWNYFVSCDLTPLTFLSNITNQHTHTNHLYLHGHMNFERSVVDAVAEQSWYYWAFSVVLSLTFLPSTPSFLLFYHYLPLSPGFHLFHSLHPDITAPLCFPLDWILKFLYLHPLHTLPVSYLSLPPFSLPLSPLSLSSYSCQRPSRQQDFPILEICRVSERQGDRLLKLLRQCTHNGLTLWDQLLCQLLCKGKKSTWLSGLCWTDLWTSSHTWLYMVYESALNVSAWFCRCMC